MVGLEPTKPARVRQGLRAAYFYIGNCTTGSNTGSSIGNITGSAIGRLAVLYTV
jgi:hypothetical protein